MKIWHICDTRSNHRHLCIPNNVDMVIHSGDCTNPRNPVDNSVELWPFVEWFRNLNIEHKVLIAGNHDSAIEGRMITKGVFAELGITYLENSSEMVGGLKIWGSPITPAYNDWCFMMKRHKIHKVWDTIPDDADIVVTHGPPKFILDLTENRDGTLEQVGCKCLYNTVVDVRPRLHCFGHVHNFKHLKNAGTCRLAAVPGTLFSNGSCVTDGKQGELSSHGNILYP